MLPKFLGTNLIVMKKTIFRYGFYGLGAGAILFGCGLLFGDSLGYRVQELIGYGSIVLSLMFVFFGIKHYRDHVRKGEISFPDLERQNA